MASKYGEKLQAVEHSIRTSQYKEAEKILSEIENYRPQKMMYFILKAMLNIKIEGTNHKIFDILNKKIGILDDEEIIHKYFEIIKEAAELSGDRGEFARIEKKEKRVLNSLTGECGEQEDFGKLEKYCVYCNHNDITYEECAKMTNMFYCYDMKIPYVIAALYCNFINGAQRFVIRKNILNTSNVNFLIEHIRNKRDFILVPSIENDYVYELIRKILSEMGCTVKYIDSGIENTDGVICDRRDEIIKSEIDSEKAYILLCNRKDMAGFELQSEIKTDMSGLIREYDHGYDNYICADIIGNYMDFISDIYCEKCDELINKSDATVKFSIVLPARNSATTLKHTIMTCLDQTYTGNFEIIISDNSTGCNSSVYELYKEISDSRIKYIKTPRDLPLTKSFEYAYLHACGEYILAIGSDDGALPWMLEKLDIITTEYQEEEIIQWERGFYAWPGFGGGQQNELIIPRKYNNSQLDAFYKDKNDYMAEILVSTDNMYLLPMLYINSCFKRTYFKTLLRKTGRLWDGICQDIYIGMVNICINDRILNIRYPLTIAGMSSGSVGANANRGNKTNIEYNKMIAESTKDNCVGGYCRSPYEKLVPENGTDVSSLYNSFLRMISLGLLPPEYVDVLIDWKKWYINIVNNLDIRDMAFDRKIHELRYAAAYHGKEFLDWFDKNLWSIFEEPEIIEPEVKDTVRTYNVGTNQNGGLILDASEYGVQDVYGAVQLFAEKSGLQS